MIMKGPLDLAKFYGHTPGPWTFGAKFVTNLADTRQDLFWLAVIAFVLWAVVPNLPVIMAVMP